MNYWTLSRLIELGTVYVVCVCVCVCVCLRLSVCSVQRDALFVLCHTQGSQGKMTESGRQKDNDRLDVSIILCHQLKVTIGIYGHVRSISDPVKYRNCCYYVIR